MSPAQYGTLFGLLVKLQREGAVEFHHGDCVGSDAYAHAVAIDLGLRVIIHPPIVDKFRAFCQGAADELPPENYMVRNQSIVLDSGTLLATPRSDVEDGSGSWSTIRFARRLGRPVAVILRNGDVKV